jgi:hypothetical protein
VRRRVAPIVLPSRASSASRGTSGFALKARRPPGGSRLGSDLVPPSSPSRRVCFPALRGLAALIGIAVLLAASGCNGEEDEQAEKEGARPAKTARSAQPDGREAGPAEREAVRKAVVRLFRTNDVEVICERSLTPRLLRLIFDEKAACRKVTAEDDDDEDPPDRVEVSDVEVRDGRAIAVTKLVGGDTAGAQGPIVLLKGRDGWRTDDFSTAFLRSSVSASLENERKIPAAVSRCIDARLQGMADAQFKRLALALIGERRQASIRLLEMVSECERRRGGVTTVRRELEKTVKGTLRKAGAGERATACTVRRLRTTLPDRVLVRLAAEKGPASRARITREVVAAAVACGARRRGGPEQLSPA